MAATDAAVRPGHRLGPYELVREIGSGGFASVWLAARSGPGGFESRVAIKLIRVELRTDPTFQKMFLDEAKLAARINHPNVVSIFELGESEDGLYLVMEYVAGRPLNILNNMMRREEKTIPVGIIMRIIADTCAGLHAAHELERDGKPLGVIHRDVSPQNILVSDQGTVKLIDFGVAKANDRLAADTTDGHTKGKLRYMAPEQALAKPVDRRADIWSAGAVAFDLLEGHPPYDGHNDLARLFKLMDDSPPPSFTTNVPAPIARVIQKALERQPEARWQTAAEMRTAIDAALEECDMRVNADAVVAFFGDALTPPGDDGDDPRAQSDRAMLRARLQRKSVRAGTTTVDVPAPGTADSDRPAPQESGIERVETLSALNTRPRGVPRRPSRALAASALGILFFVGVALFIGLRHEPPANVPAREPAAAAAAPPPVDPRAIPEPTPGPSAAPSSVASAASSEASVMTIASTPAIPVAKPIARPKRPRGGKPPSAVGSPTSRPRYDDTIQ